MGILRGLLGGRPLETRGSELEMDMKWQETQFALSQVISVGFAVGTHESMLCLLYLVLFLNHVVFKMGGRIPTPPFLS